MTSYTQIVENNNEDEQHSAADITTTTTNEEATEVVVLQENATATVEEATTVVVATTNSKSEESSNGGSNDNVSSSNDEETTKMIISSSNNNNNNNAEESADPSIQDDKGSRAENGGEEVDLKVEEVQEQQPRVIENEDGSINCYSDRLKLSFRVYVQNNCLTSSQTCYALTIHDLGFDHKEFEEFVMSPEMSGLRSRIVWLNVDLPGQGLGDADLGIKKYPSLEEIAAELINVLDHFKIPQVVCVGDGAGASVAVHFAIKHPNRCLGVVAIEPIASSASFIELMKYKLHNLNLFQKSNMNAHEKANVILNHFKKVNSSSDQMANELLNMNESEKKIYENRSVRNLSLFAETFLNRSSLVEKLGTLSVDVLTVAGRHSSGYHEAKKFFKSLQESRKRSPQHMVNCPFIEIDGSSHVIKENSEKLATSLQFFLQGIGLVSAMPMKNSLKGLGSSTPSYGRSGSMEEADKPHNSSSSASQSESASQIVSSNPSISIPE